MSQKDQHIQPWQGKPQKSEDVKHIAEIAQLVEHNLAKVGVASSSLVFRSKSKGWLNASLFDFRIIGHLRSDPKISPFRGRGCKYSSRHCTREAWARVSFSALTHSGNRKIVAFFVRFAEASATIYTIPPNLPLSSLRSFSLLRLGRTNLFALLSP